MASSQEKRGTTRKPNLPYNQSLFDEYEDEYQNEDIGRTNNNRDALYNSEYIEDEGEYEEHDYRDGKDEYEEHDYRDGKFGEYDDEEGEYTEDIDPDTPTSPSNGQPLPSPPPSPPTDDGYDNEDSNVNTANLSSSFIPPPPPSRSKKLPSLPQYTPDRSQTVFRPSAPTPTHSKRKNYFTTLFKFKKSNTPNTRVEEIRNIGSPLPEPPQDIQITLPSLAPSSPISHQLPAEYLEFEEEADNQSDVHTTPELTMDDLYHLVLNMQKGFQLQVSEMNSQIKELKREIKRLKGEEESEEEEEKKDLEDLRSPSRTATSVRSVAREMERGGGEGRWFHNEYS